MEGDVQPGEIVDCPVCNHTFEVKPEPPPPRVHVTKLPDKPAPPPAKKRRPIVTFWGVVKATIVALLAFIGFVIFMTQMTKARERREQAHQRRMDEIRFTRAPDVETINLSRQILKEIRGSEPPWADVETYARLSQLTSFARLDDVRIAEAAALRAELALHYPMLAARFSIGTKSVSFDSSP